MENWKPIMGFESYEVSNLGRVRSTFRGRYKVLKLEKQKDTGYLRANLYIGGKRRILHRKVHRLVATAFLINPENKPEVNHKNGDKENCSSENLEWCTPSENTKHAIVLGLHHGSRDIYGKYSNTTEQGFP